MNYNGGRAGQSPVELTEDEVRQAANGRSEEVVAKSREKGRPVDLDESEVALASEGRSQDVLVTKQSSE